MKTKFTNYLLIFTVLAVVCMCIFTACNKNETPEEDPPEELGPYDTPSGFDSKKEGAAYGTLEEKSYYSTSQRGFSKELIKKELRFL
jgi:hypothetical protein